MRLSSLPSLAPFPVLSALFVPSRILSSPLHYDLDDGSSESSMSEERTTGVRHEILNRSISMKRTCDPSVYFQDSSLRLRFFSLHPHSITRWVERAWERLKTEQRESERCPWKTNASWMIDSQDTSTGKDDYRKARHTSTGKDDNEKARPQNVSGVPSSSSKRKTWQITVEKYKKQTRILQSPHESRSFGPMFCIFSRLVREWWRKDRGKNERTEEKKTRKRWEDWNTTHCRIKQEKRRYKRWLQMFRNVPLGWIQVTILAGP